MIKYYSIAFIAVLVFGLARFQQDALIIEPDQKVSSILEALGEDFSSKKPDFSIKGVSAEVGETLFFTGFAPKVGGGKSGKQSKHFVCTSCHNTKREDPDLTISDPEARLQYTAERNMPFLQGTTMYGAVNRESYYNGDYFKKYGELVYEARNSIRNAIQLCATECAQGRALDDWELESLLAFLWTIELTAEDIGIDGIDLNDLSVDDIKSKYLLASPATFITPPEDRKLGTGLVGDPERGGVLYRNSCLHCHFRGEYSFFHLDDTKMSLKHMEKNIGKYSRHSIYQVIRWGVPVKSGKASYMPQYPKEKMSNQQLADLRSYIETYANK